MNIKIKLLLTKELYPFNYFKDCNKGNKITQLNAYLYNKENAHLLVIPILNWIIINLYLSMILLILQKCHLETEHYLFTTFIAILFTIGIIQNLIFSIIYFYLNNINLINES